MSRHSPCRAHFERALAASQQPAGNAHQQTAAAANAYELMLHKLAEDKRRLKDLQSIERKAEVKAQLLPEYLPWITGVLESESGRQDDVLMTVFVWAIDIGRFDLALDIGAYAIEHKLVMPDQYKRDVPCVLAEEIADAAIKAADDARVAMLNAIRHAANLTAEQDMPDEVRAKLMKALGYALRAAGSLPESRDCLARALELDQRVGVKKDIERLDTAIKNSAPAVDGEKPPKTEGA
jgi:hypothetical protein